MPMRSLSFTDIKAMVKKMSLFFLKLTVELYMQTCQWALNSGKNSEIQVDFWPKFYILAKQNAKNGQFARILDFATGGSGYVQILLIWILWPKFGLKYKKNHWKWAGFPLKKKNLHFFLVLLPFTLYITQNIDSLSFLLLKLFIFAYISFLTLPLSN